MLLLLNTSSRSSSGGLLVKQLNAFGNVGTLLLLLTLLLTWLSSGGRYSNPSSAAAKRPRVEGISVRLRLIGHWIRLLLLLLLMERGGRVATAINYKKNILAFFQKQKSAYLRPRALRLKSTAEKLADMRSPSCCCCCCCC